MKYITINDFSKNWILKKNITIEINYNKNSITKQYNTKKHYASLNLTKKTLQIGADRCEIIIKFKNLNDKLVNKKNLRSMDNQFINIGIQNNGNYVKCKSK